MKIVRTVLETVFLLILLAFVLNALFSFNHYKHYDSADVGKNSNGKNGFIALSYFGVDRDGDATLISTERLEEQLQALYDQGYVTITQEDIVNHYEKGTPLPEKSLFLMFEDGRRDTAIFAQKILEKYNFKASMLTYAEKFEEDDPKFLSAEDLTDLEDSSYWELGTNGYRLFFINVFDRYDYYLGELSTLEFAEMSDCLGRNYNHYLMDYIRDKYGVPKESYREMYARISADYEGMEREYTEKIGELPGLYSLMHANTGQFGNCEKVSSTNGEWIYKLFDLNFNREGFCWNSADDKDHSIYDLTRMQPQSYWYTNHLLMRIKYDSGLETKFINGDDKEYQNWDVRQGALECKKEKLIVTSEPESEGLTTLKNIFVRNCQVDLELTGNKLGTQTLYLRADEEVSNAVYVSIQNNVLKIGEVMAGEKVELFSLNLDDFDGKNPLSTEEDEKNARLKELSALERYAKDTEEAVAYNRDAKEVEEWEAASVADGAEEYIPDIDIREAGDRMLSIVLEDGKIKVAVDGKTAASDLELTNMTEGQICLGCQWGGYGWSQRNLSDDVYDGVFEKLSIKTLPDEEGISEIIYDDLLHGMDKMIFEMSGKWRTLINWFIKNL